jgi:hypothetical protein
MLAMRQSLSFPSSNWATSDDPCGLPSKNWCLSGVWKQKRHFSLLTHLLLFSISTAWTGLTCVNSSNVIKMYDKKRAIERRGAREREKERNRKRNRNRKRKRERERERTNSRYIYLVICQVPRFLVRFLRRLVC